MYPNLFIIGAAKSGTSSLHYYLDQHPDVHMSRVKEPHFFSRSSDGSWPVTRPVSEREYQRLFETDRPIRGESSVTYSFWPHPAGIPQKIYAVAPDARFIYVVRDPVARSISHYFHRVGLGTEHRTLQEVVGEPNDADERYIAASSYATQLRQYLELYPMDRFLVLDQHDLLMDRGSVLRECFDFLDVDPSFTSPNWDISLNESADQRRFGGRVNRFRQSPVYLGLTGWMRPDVRQRLIGPVRRLLSSEVPRAPVDDATRAYFAEQLRGEAEELRRLTGKAFPTWSV